MKLVEVRTRISSTAAAILERNAAEIESTIQETARLLFEQFAAAFEPARPAKSTRPRRRSYAGPSGYGWSARTSKARRPETGPQFSGTVAAWQPGVLQ